MFYTYHQDLGWLRRASPTSLSPSFACGPQYGLAHSPPCPEEAGRHWQPSRRSSSHPHTYIWTHTNIEAHKLVDRLTAPPSPAPTTPPTTILLGAGPWIGDMWLGEMRHNAGLSLDRSCACLLACELPAWNASQKPRSFVFHPSDYRNRPAFSSPWILTTVAFSLYCFLWQFFSLERSISVSLSVDIYNILSYMYATEECMDTSSECCIA